MPPHSSLHEIRIESHLSPLFNARFVVLCRLSSSTKSALNLVNCTHPMTTIAEVCRFSLNHLHEMRANFSIFCRRRASGCGGRWTA
jgi:hypothetical protein